MSTKFLLQNFNSLIQETNSTSAWRTFILDMAIRGKLVKQNPKDEPAETLLEKIAVQKEKLIKKGKIKSISVLQPIKDDEIPFSIPDSWEWVRLHQIGNIYNGNSINATVKAEKYLNIKNGLPFIATKDVGYGWDDLNYNNGVSIPKGESKFKVAPANTVLICSEGGSAGKKCGLTTKDICFGNKLIANKLYGGIESVFILSVYQTTFFNEQFVENMTGIIKGISILKFSSLIIPLPPLAEQKRIVTKVNKLMKLCDKLEAELSAAQESRQALLRSVMKRAVSDNH